MQKTSNFPITHSNAFQIQSGQYGNTAIEIHSGDQNLPVNQVIAPDDDKLVAIYDDLSNGFND